MTVFFLPSLALRRFLRSCACAKSFGFGDVVEVCGLAVAVPEGVVVELKRPEGGFVFQKHGTRTLLEEVEALKVWIMIAGVGHIGGSAGAVFLLCDAFSQCLQFV